MQLAALGRRHWVAIAMLVGLSIGLVRQACENELSGLNIDGYGIILTDQQQFESGLVQDLNGTRLFSEPTVYPRWITDANGKKKRVDLVAGRFWDGRVEFRDGKELATWLPRCFIAQRPYRPRITVRGNGGASRSEYPSVLDFLAALHRAYGVNYQYAWWAVHPLLTCMGGCVLLIGLTWPTLVNLLAFGALSRPPDVKPISLWKVRRRSAPQPMPPTMQTTPSAEIAHADPAGAGNPVPERADDATSAPTVQALSGRPLQAMPAEMPDEREYAADDDDFYPTERRARSYEPPGP